MQPKVLKTVVSDSIPVFERRIHVPHACNIGEPVGSRGSGRLQYRWLIVQGARGSGSTELDGRCDASNAAFTVGKPATPELLEQARKASGAQIARVLKPTDMITLEYRSERLNLNADDKGVVTRVNCG